MQRLSKKIKKMVSIFTVFMFFTIGLNPSMFAASLETGSTATLYNNLQEINKSTSEYFSEHLPFMASLGKNDYRASLKGGILPISFLISAGFGIGMMGGMDELNTAAGDDKFISSGGYPANIFFPVGPTFYLRLGIPILPLIGNIEIGFKYVVPIDLPVDDFEFKNDGFGVDLRYAILRGSALLFPALSVGVSYDTLKGNLFYKGNTVTPLGTVTSKMGPEWNIWNMDIYVKASSQLLSLVSVTLGAALGIKGGSTESGFRDLTLGGTSYDDVLTKSDASGTDLKVMAGVSIFIFYLQANQNITTGDSAISMAATYSF